jgi:hypothetical protein
METTLELQSLVSKAQAGKAVNRTIAQETKVKDFLNITTKAISINSKYLKPYKSL